MQRLHIGEWEVFPELNRIRRGAEERHMEPRVMDLLVHLAARPGEVVAKDRIIQAVWSDCFVSDGALTYALGQLRQLLDDDARQPRFIETIPRRGYRLIAPVRRDGDGDSVPAKAERGDPGERGPYPGLSAFTEHDSAWFFGRETEVDALWERIRRRPLTAVIGSSGSGKTSFLRAGVIARRPEGWGAEYATPGSQPALGVVRALSFDLAQEPETLRELLSGVEELGRAGDPGRLVRTARCWRERWNEALLVVDQFEELFTLNPPESQSGMAALLAGLVAEAGIRVVLSMRDDFLIRCSDYPELGDVFEALTPLPVLRHEGLRRALVAPAEGRGYRFEDDALVAEMVDTVAGVRGALPLQAFAVAQLWERRDRDRRLLTREAYRAIGGVEGALAQHAEATLERIGTARRPLVRELFRNLVTAQGTRAVMDREELLSAFPQRGEAELVLGALVNARLLTTFEVEGQAGEAGRHRVEVVHESLLRQWPRLVRWQAQDEEGAVLRDQLRQAAHLWDERGRPEDLLWSGTAFREYQVWRERYPGSLTALEEDFSRSMSELAGRRRRRRRWAVAALVAGLSLVAVSLTFLWQDAVRSRAAAEWEALRSESSKLLALAEARLEEDPTEALAFATASLDLADSEDARVFAVRALAEGPPVVEFRHEDSQWRAPAFSPDGRRMASAGFASDVAVLAANGQLLARLQGHGTDPRDGMAVHWASDDSVVTGFFPGRAEDVRVWSVPDGSELNAISFGGPSTWAARLGRLYAVTTAAGATGERVARLRSWRLPDGPEEDLGRFNWTAEGARTGFLTSDARSFLYLKGRSAALRPLDGGADRVFSRHSQELTQMGWFPASDRFWFRDEAGDLRIWTFDGSLPVSSIDVPKPETAPATVLPEESGRWVWKAPAGDSELKLWSLDALPGARPIKLRRDLAWYASMCGIDPAGDWGACSVRSASHNVFWPLPRNSTSVVEGYRALTRSVVFSPDSRWMASFWDDQRLRLWPLPESGSRDLRFFDVTINDGKCIVFDPNGRFVFLGGNFGAALVVPLDGQPSRRLEGYPSSQLLMGGAVSPSGRQVATAAQYGIGPKVIRVWNLDRGSVKEFPQPGDLTDNPQPSKSPASGYEGGINSLAFFGEDTLFTGGAGGVMRWDLGTGRSEVVAAGEWTVFWPVGFGSKLIVLFGLFNSDAPPTNCVFDLATAACESVMDFKPWGGMPGFMMHSLGYGNHALAVGSLEGLIRVGRINGGPTHLLAGHRGMTNFVAVSGDGKWVASTGADNTLRLWPMPDLSKPSLHSLPYPDLLAKLKSLTNLRAVRDPATSAGWSIEVGPFPGWAKRPEW